MWLVNGWQVLAVYTPLTLVERLLRWRHELSTQSQVLVTERPEQVKQLNAAYLPDVAQVLAMKGQAGQKVTHILGGVHLLLVYLERLGLAEVVGRHCG